MGAPQLRSASEFDYSPLVLSLLVAGTAMLIVAPIGTLFAWWIAQTSRLKLRAAVQALVTMPLVLPPTVVGYYLLEVLGHGTSFGRWINDTLGIRLLFTWQGAALAAAVMSFPLFVRSAAAGFSTVARDLIESARTAGAGEGSILLRVIVPLSYHGWLAGLALSFARALGEFGATLIVAGSIPGRTRTLPLALYSAIETGDDATARTYTAILTGAAFVFVGAVSGYEYWLEKQRR
jgi:molybdate transport system permease protein